MIRTVCGVPAVAVMDAGAAVFVRLNAPTVPIPGTVAFTTNAPAEELAVNTGAVATPLALVFAVAVNDPPANVPVGPDVKGAVNVTVTPGMGALLPSRTVTCSAVGNAVPVNVDWGVPAVVARVACVFSIFTTNASPTGIAPADPPP